MGLRMYYISLGYTKCNIQLKMVVSSSYHSTPAWSVSKAQMKLSYEMDLKYLCREIINDLIFNLFKVRINYIKCNKSLSGIQRNNIIWPKYTLNINNVLGSIQLILILFEIFNWKTASMEKRVQGHLRKIRHENKANKTKRYFWWHVRIYENTYQHNEI